MLKIIFLGLQGYSMVNLIGKGVGIAMFTFCYTSYGTVGVLSYVCGFE
jgi:hypothetical protein